MPQIIIKNPKALNKEAWDGLRGTALYEQMFRNRCFYDVDKGLNSAKDEARKVVSAFIFENANSFYYHDHIGNVVYIESDTDAVYFKMAMHAYELQIVEDVRAGPRPRTPSPSPTPRKITPSGLPQEFQDLLDSATRNDEWNNHGRPMLNDPDPIQRAKILRLWDLIGKEA